ncbi:GpE family phage tail protein [Mergibacter septicus]|uniref:GpE family phage tail protein n=1 Tax=Mergibacter septicus TaxID=221402 RepID=A0A8E3MI28_9PAST|nr:GpE family phage tail protein [Mergibacter septicus]QDJ13885.1 GpE family phage tail protein [Mergibacter septicus]QDJ15556.1 GpE family phage tail protein [Mergibacter septicus]UTU48862.1 GpE family phage tail protein [Mergibacter septicus]
MPATVEDAIADIATVFHWTPQAFEQMDLNELMMWREKARERNQVDE